MRFRRTLFALSAGTVVCAGYLLFAQENDSSVDEKDLLFRTRVDVVQVPTTVLDKDDAYVSGIQPSEFRLFDNNQPQEIKVTETLAPISLVVAIQADAKVEAVIPKIQKLGTMFQNMVAGEAGEVAILSFDHRIQKLQDFTNDPTKLQEALKQLKPGSSSSRMIDALVDATRMLRSRPKDRRRVVLLISESRDKSSAGGIREALTNTQIADVSVYALNMSRLFTEFTAKNPPPRPDAIPATARHVPAGGVQTPTSTAQLTGSQGYSANFVPLFEEVFRSVKAIFVDNPVEVFTKYTGGREIPFVTQEALERAVAEIGREVHNQYMISYNPNNKLEGGFHEIKVVIPTRRNVTIRTRPGYWLAAVKE